MITSQNINEKGLAALTTNPDTTNHTHNRTDNSAANQRSKLLAYLQAHGSITTSEARQLLDIYYPPARVFELKQEGYFIETLWQTWVSEYGAKHRKGRYVLTRKKPLNCTGLGNNYDQLFNYTE